MHLNSSTLIAIATLSLAAAGTALAATPIYQTGFEQPTFVPGNLEGQQEFFLLDGGPGETAIANVTTARSNGGTQSVGLSGTGTGSDGFGATAYAAKTISYVSNPLEPIVTVSFDMNWDPAGTRSQFYGMELYRYVGQDAFLFASVGALDLFGIAASGVVFDATGNAVTIPGGDITLGTWNNFAIQLNFATQTYRGIVNGNSSGDIPFDSPTLTFDEFDLWRQGQAGLNSSDVAYYDNISIVASAIPEPATLGVLGGVLITALRRRR